MKDIPLEQLKQEIPHGPYCYEVLSFTRTENGAPISAKVKNCPYWSIDNSQEYQDNGYCSYLEIGDWMDDPSNTWRRPDNGETIHIGLLWDQVKACGINDDEEDDLYEQDDEKDG